MSAKNITILLMDAPFEDARSTTALRILDAAARRGHNLTVFAYEGAVYLPFSKQARHPNAAHGRTIDEEDHPLPREWIASIRSSAEQHGGKLDWINCGLCVDERGAGEAIEGVRRGGHPDFWAQVGKDDNVLVIATK